MASAAQHPVDLGHLDRYTGGNRALNEEILRLFEAQCRELLTKLEGFIATRDSRGWREIAHALKGAAAGVGAFALAKAAAEAEAADPADKSAAKAALSRLKATAQAVDFFIEGFLKD